MEPSARVDPRSLMQHRAFVRKVVRGLVVDEHAVDDVEQETWLRALESGPRRPAALRAWLARVGRNLALTARRGERRRARRERAVALEGVMPSAADAASRLERHRLVVDAVLALDEPFRSAVLLRFYEDLPPREIARVLGVPVATVRSRVRRGIERMREWFDARHGGDRAAWCVLLLPLLGVSEAAAAAGGTKVLVVKGATMSAKAKLVGAALLVCAAAATIVAWQSARAKERAPTPRVEPAPQPELPVEPWQPEKDVVDPADLLEAPEGDAVRGNVVVAGASEAEAEEEKPYRLAEPTGEAEHGSLRVLVVDDGGAPVAGARVYRAVSRDGRTTSANHEVPPDGRLELRGLSPGRHTISAVVGQRQRLAGVMIEAGRFTEVTFAFAPGATVEGEVRHVARGPLPKLNVSVHHQDAGFQEWSRATTDAEGRFRLEGLAPGDHPVTLTGPFLGYDQRPRATISVPGPGTFTRDIVIGRPNLKGFVRDAETGAPLAGVQLQLYEPSYVETSTNAQGQYAFADLPPGEYRLCLVRDGYATEFVETGPVPAEGAREVDFTLRAAAVLVVEVRDTDGRPVPGRHSLGLSSAGEPGTSLGTSFEVDAAGIGRYPRILPGTWDVRVRAEGYAPASQRVLVKPGENRIRVRLEPAEEQGDISLVGTVRDAVTGRPIAGARVAAQQPVHKFAMTDADGVYRLRGVPPGKARLVVSRDGYGIRFVRDVDVGKEAAKTDFELVPAATLHLHVTDKLGNPVVGRIFLGIHGSEEGLTRVGTSVEADAEGHAVYKQIVPGRYKLRVLRGGLGEANVEIEIIAGENAARVRLE